MPYSSISKLPSRVTQHLPKHAQEIYKEAYNSAYNEYKDSSSRKGGVNHEETSHRVAWSAVKRHYVKDDDGSWQRKQ